MVGMTDAALAWNYFYGCALVQAVGIRATWCGAGVELLVGCVPVLAKDKAAWVDQRLTALVRQKKHQNISLGTIVALHSDRVVL